MPQPISIVKSKDSRKNCFEIKWSRRMPGGAGHHALILGTVMPAAILAE